MIRPILLLIDTDQAYDVGNMTSVLHFIDDDANAHPTELQPKYGDSAWVPMELYMQPNIDETYVQQFLDLHGIAVAVVKTGRQIGDNGLWPQTTETSVRQQSSSIDIIGRLVVSAAAPRMTEIDGSNEQPLLLDRASFRVKRDGRWLRLNPMDFELLEYFHTNSERVIPRSELITALWTQDKHIQERTVDVRVKRLREALGDHGNDGLIRTHRNAGYYFSEPHKI